MLRYFPLPCAIVDIETTGGNVTQDRVTEIGIVEVTEDGVSEWSSLVNPRTSIPWSIQRLTGITNEMVAEAPYFEHVAKEIVLRLQGKLFIAHNVRFDYGFLRNEFARLAYSFSSKLLCTVKLSRHLYPEANGHSLEKIIRRHQIYVGARHRALDDARATYKFMLIAEEEKGRAQVNEAVERQYRQASAPAHIDSHLVSHLPTSPGVYYFWGERQELLYIGKSINIKKRVQSHFTADHRSSREMTICQQVRNITFDDTAGELTALILESKQIKALQPIYNRKLRRVRSFQTIQLIERENGALSPDIIEVGLLSSINERCYGLFASQKKAKEAIKSICIERQLCYQLCGLENSTSRACSAHQLKKCDGYCIGKRSCIEHNVKLMDALGALALKAWPYTGPVALTEKSVTGKTQHVIVHNWIVLGVADSENEVHDLLDQTASPYIDKDSYQYLVKAIFSKNYPVAIQTLY